MLTLKRIIASLFNSTAPATRTLSDSELRDVIQGMEKFSTERFF